MNLLIRFFCWGYTVLFYRWLWTFHSGKDYSNINKKCSLFESVIGMVLVRASNPPKRPANFALETSATPSFLILFRKALHLIKQLIPSSSNSSRKGCRYHRPFISTRPPVEKVSDQLDFFWSRQLNGFINLSSILQVSIQYLRPRQLFSYFAVEMVSLGSTLYKFTISLLWCVLNIIRSDNC